MDTSSLTTRNIFTAAALVAFFIFLRWLHRKCTRRTPEEYALHFFREGRYLFSKGHLDQALIQFTRAILLPTSPQLKAAFYDCRAMTYFQKGQWELALQDHQDAIAADPTNPELARNLELTQRAKAIADAKAASAATSTSQSDAATDVASSDTAATDDSSTKADSTVAKRTAAGKSTKADPGDSKGSAEEASQNSTAAAAAASATAATVAAAGAAAPSTTAAPSPRKAGKKSRKAD